jgi:hypothetical protein
MQCVHTLACTITICCNFTRLKFVLRQCLHLVVMGSAEERRILPPQCKWRRRRRACSLVRRAVLTCTCLPCSTLTIMRSGLGYLCQCSYDCWHAGAQSQPCRKPGRSGPSPCIPATASQRSSWRRAPFRASASASRLTSRRAIVACGWFMCICAVHAFCQPRALLWPGCKLVLKVFCRIAGGSTHTGSSA